ncbi:tetratricopeptide repeat protein [Candidatus Palauibacter polyketidifaciens]|uniref:tetratricopeptide repeat protein n=1 Tax=Candidatus Palauibacter polyketidifaciens TaxID=3056740 RepID=UPI00239F0DA4|nr:tetratricopeptide repeat protein [Candidatus Palauibacter polyketidifaciens]MDE2721700.1 tetratricopeptide repeat protein [Candidatus Palauibacter polyketidifaciens]
MVTVRQWIVQGTAGVLAALAVAACEDPVDRSVVRGDRYLAVGDADMAIAEYLLARRVSGDTDDLLLRLGQAHAARGDVDEALTVYETLAERDPRLRHQAAASLAGLAWSAQERGAAENMSRALQPLVDWGLGYLPADLQRSLAAYHAAEGDYARALSLRLALLAGEGEPEPAVLYDVGLAYEQLGACTRALPFYRSFLEAMEESRSNPEDARYRYGNCLYVSAAEDRAEGRPAAALEKLTEMVELGEPRTHMVEAHFLIGELHLALGQTDEALVNYARVLELNPTRTHALVRRAEERIRQIRFGFE